MQRALRLLRNTFGGFAIIMRTAFLVILAAAGALSDITAFYGDAFQGVAVNAKIGSAMDPSWPAAKMLAMLHATAGPWNKFITSAMHNLGTSDREGQRLASMSSYACGFNFAAGASVDRGLLVEFGTWAGGSMRCFAAGVNQTGHVDRAVGFDAFKAGFVHGNEKQLTGTRWWDPRKTTRQMQDLDLLPIYNWNVQDVYPSIQARRVNFREVANVDRELGAAAVIDVFITDAAKHSATLVQDLMAAAPYLRPGSVLVFADFGFYKMAGTAPKSNQIMFVFGQLVDSGLLRFLGLCGSYGYFALTEAVSRPSMQDTLGAWKKKADDISACRAAKQAALSAITALGPKTNFDRAALIELRKVTC